MKVPKRLKDPSNLRASSHPNDRVRIFFKLQQDEDGYPPAVTESLWAISLGEGRFRLENTPFFVTGVSHSDVVRAHRGDDRRLWFDELAEASGHSTVRVVICENSPDTRPIKKRMQALQESVARLGCSFESSHLPNLVSIDIPPDVPLGPLTALLEAGHQGELWDYEEAAIAHTQ